MMDGVLIGVVTLLVIGLGMAVIAVRLIYQPKRNRWQIAWLLFTGAWTVYPGHLTLSALGSAVSLWSQGRDPNQEDIGWIFLGLIMWVVPIASLYLLGVTIAWLLRKRRKLTQ
jgi:hypothetical protein